MIRIMTKTLLSLVAVAALAGLATFLINSFGFVAAIAVGVVAVIGWAVAAWYYADDTPMLAPRNTPGRVTFLQIVQDFFRDLVATTRPIWLRLWLNIQFVAVLGVDAVALATPEMRDTIMSSPWFAVAFVALNLIARYGSTPAHAPVMAR